MDRSGGGRKGVVYRLIPFFNIFVIVREFFRSAWFKGKFGEFTVNLALNFNLPKKHYHLIKNVTLPSGNGTTQIDHIVVSRFGIFVIETKNMTGWIFGSAKQRTWTQKIFKYTKKFQNPLHQNYKHTKTLESILGISGDAIHSVIVFAGDSTFKTEMPENVNGVGGSIRYIKSMNRELFTPGQVQEIISKISAGSFERGRKTNTSHVLHVKSVVEERKAAVLENRCPQCGANMVIRETKRGPNAGSQFWGCSTFPRCRSTAPLN